MTKKIDETSWLRAIVLSGIFAGAIGYIPDSSALYYEIGFGLAILYIAANIEKWSNTFWSYFVRSYYITIILEIISLRFALHLLPLSWVWGITIFRWTSLFVISLVPVFDPTLSELMRREQFAPSTRPGKLIYSMGLWLIVAGGLMGALLGLISGRLGKYDAGMWIIMLLFWIGTLSLCQLASHFLITKRPWESTYSERLGKL